MKPAKYTQIIIRIAEREDLSPEAAVELYRLAKRLRVRSLGRGLSGRVADRLDKRDFRHTSR